MSGFYLLGYLLPVALFGLSAWGYSTRFLLARRGVRVEGRRSGESWYAGIYSPVFLYKDETGESHRLTVSPENVPREAGRKIGVVYDPKNPDSALSEFELRKPAWRSIDMLLFSVGAVVAVFYTVVILLWV
ncbi:DUF3592 domain-containing protein [Streptomyces zaehneri]|uniref:DUF3592 domain-containing protein n=1 Tax=Streptomyces zaehneri TaxID=3051180 RepID=UPI0028D10126|nr:DUF3592 domain-containing protein [Streptomyces sp. DSM 40713]